MKILLPKSKELNDKINALELSISNIDSKKSDMARDRDDFNYYKHRIKTIIRTDVKTSKFRYQFWGELKAHISVLKNRKESFKKALKIVIEEREHFNSVISQLTEIEIEGEYPTFRNYNEESFFLGIAFNDHITIHIEVRDGEIFSSIQCVSPDMANPEYWEDCNYVSCNAIQVDTGDSNDAEAIIKLLLSKCEAAKLKMMEVTQSDLVNANQLRRRLDHAADSSFYALTQTALRTGIWDNI